MTSAMAPGKAGPDPSRIRFQGSVSCIATVNVRTQAAIEVLAVCLFPEAPSRIRFQGSVSCIAHDGAKIGTADPRPGVVVMMVVVIAMRIIVSPWI